MGSHVSRDRHTTADVLLDVQRSVFQHDSVCVLPPAESIPQTNVIIDQWVEPRSRQITVRASDMLVQCITNALLSHSLTSLEQVTDIAHRFGHHPQDVQDIADELRRRWTCGEPYVSVNCGHHAKVPIMVNLLVDFRTHTLR